MSRARVSSTPTAGLYSQLVRVLPALFLGAALCTTASGAVSRHVVEQANTGTVQAQLSYDYHAYRFGNPRLTIQRAGVTLRDAPVRAPRREFDAQPANYFAHRKSVFVRDLDGDREPEVYLDLYAGGAHCCWYTEVFRYAAGRYSLQTQIWWNVGYRSADLDRDGLLEFVSGDNRFAYEFADFAESRWPIQIWSYRAGRFTDVTRRFPAAIARDARALFRSQTNRRYFPATNHGVLAAWAADECLLGRCASAFKKLEAMGRAGQLRNHGACCDSTTRAYLRHLRRFLRRTGYLG
jgi:hypothetical protein